MAHRSSPLPIPAANHLVIVVPSAIADCNHPRLYSQPDCNSGWDSAREKYYNGYHLYMISAADSKHDLPLYPRLQPASRHDAVSLVMSTVEFKQRFTLGTVDKMLLDAAHDAEAIYLLLDHQNIQPFIDLNNGARRIRRRTVTFRFLQPAFPSVQKVVK
ncbi:hypothetical protein PAAL109150_18750 [Paenibacillus alkaliterrae]